MLKLKAYLKSLSLIFAMTSLFSAASAWSAEILSAKDRAIIPVAAFTASGESEKLKISLNEALDAGLTINELKEVLVQLYAYAGFPRSLNGLATFMTVLDARKSQGIQDVLGRESSPLPTDKSSLELGTENQTKLIGVEVKGALFDFSPQVDEYLKAHLFGDIFERDVLSWKQRELATIAALANIHGVNSQLAAHFNISMNNHISPAELKAFISVLKTYCGEAISVNAQQVLDQVLASKQ
ncbi:carboxymuconolactone decarboxylase family protein [Vibrio fluvialis]|nr:carboxymuconolactone decarboxylase family protein [Vibrio fluvialis]ELI1839984.1 carboxymuconolactone decarboxylase family protein [Vibrio fluvialis]